MTGYCVYIDKVNIVILAGGRDFGRCPIASRLPVSLWPVFQQPAVERVVKAVSDQGIKNVYVCYEGDLDAFEIQKPGSDFHLSLQNEPLRVGTAGCLRDAAEENFDGLFVVIPASIIHTPDINFLVESHLRQKAVLSAVLNPGYEKSPRGGSAGLYVCDKTVLEYIPRVGYCDIKEWLIPEMLRKGKSVKALELPRDAGNFRDGPGYLRALANYLETGLALDNEVSSLHRRGEYWIDENADVDSSARIIGPVVVMAGAQIAKGAVVFGPAVIGQNCRIGTGNGRKR